MLLDLATGISRNDTRWHNEKWSWENLVARCRKVQRTGETYAQYMAGSVDFKQSKKDCGGFVSGFIDGGRRLKTAVLSKQIVTLDVDYAKPDFLDVLRAKLGNVAWIYYTTHSHSPDKPRYRLLIPLDRPAVQAEYEPIARYIAGYLGIDQFDRTCYDLNRLMFWPSAADDADFQAGHNDGMWTSVDGVLGCYTNWRDVSSWPVGDGEILQIRDEVAKMEDPRLKSGVIGAFCKLYTVHALIATHLSDRYMRGDKPDRYTYIHGSVGNGLWVIDDYTVHSFNNTDPIGGSSCNVFDLFRLHKFGGADEDPAQAMGNRKSFKACSEYVRNLPEVRKLMNIERYSANEIFGVPVPVQQQAQPVYPPPVANIPFSAQNIPFSPINVPIGPEIVTQMNGHPLPHQPTAAMPAGEVGKTVEVAPGFEWLGNLETDPKGKALSTISNSILVMQNDPRLKGCFARDIFAKRIVIRKDLPWNIAGRSGEEWTDVDDDALVEFMERNYHQGSKEKVLCALNIVTAQNGFHPVKEYLESLTWDRVPRVEQLFHYFLGVEDNHYTRQVSRKWFTAAVARIYRPGVKFDYMPVFVGKAGLGKSYLIDKLGGKWFSDTSVDLRNKKESMEEVQGVWLMEWGELTSFRTSSIEAVKAFVSKRRDRYRAAYARRTEEHPRQLVFAGSTNVPKFLSDPDGNRRFWPLYVNRTPIQRSVHEDFTEELRGQIWAEACYIYAMGESLMLDAAAIEMAEQVQLSHTEVDAREHTIYEYINRPVPVDWHGLNKGERAAYLGLGDFGNQPAGDVQIGGDKAPRDKVSITEIWIEALGGDIKTMTKQNTRVIHDIMRNMDGWALSENPLQFGAYPRERGYVRVGSGVKVCQK